MHTRSLVACAAIVLAAPIASVAAQTPFRVLSMDEAIRAATDKTRSRVAMLQYRANVRTAELAVTQARIKLLPLIGARAGDPPVDTAQAAYRRAQARLALAASDVVLP
jgi:hypothetical protein